MLRIKDYMGKTLATSPYQKTIKALVVCTEPPKCYVNDRGEERQMKVSAIADNETAVKMIVYDPMKFKNVVQGKSIILRNFIPKGDNIVITKNSYVLLTTEVVVPQDVQDEATNILYPPPPPIIQLKDAKTSPLKRRLSIQGKVVEVSC